MTEKYTIDPAELKNGDTIPVAYLEQQFGVSRHTSDYAFKLMALKTQLQQSLYKRTGRRPTITTHEQCINILAGNEADDYNVKRQEDAYRSIRRSQTRRQDIDVRELTPERRSTHDASVCIGAQLVLCSSSIMRKLRAARILQPTPVVSSPVKANQRRRKELPSLTPVG